MNLVEIIKHIKKLNRKVILLDFSLIYIIFYIGDLGLYFFGEEKKKVESQILN